MRGQKSNTIKPSSICQGRENDSSQVATDVLVYEDLAFASDSKSDDEEEWVTATARAPFSYDNNMLNVELFGSVSWNRVLCFIPGICESAETWTVQNLARICQSRKWRLAVLELEGHGLSSGPRGLLKSGKLKDRYVPQVIKCCQHVLTVIQGQKEQNNDGDDAMTKFALSGASFGGVLAAYASQQIRNEYSSSFGSRFVGTLLISPAVGVDPNVLPPPYIVRSLSLLSWIMPAVGFMTPSEDPSHYNCPASTKRNFKGHWPLGTSKFILDVTSEIVPHDVQGGALNLTSDSGLPTVVIISGDKDPVIPIQVVRDFVQIMLKQQNYLNSIELIEIPRGDHGLLAQPVAHASKTKKKTTKAAIEHVISFLARCNKDSSSA